MRSHLALREYSLCIDIASREKSLTNRILDAERRHDFTFVC